MITAKDLVKNNGLNNKIFDDFIEEYVIPEYNLTGDSRIRIWCSSWGRVYDQYWANGMLRNALELRGFGTDTDYDQEFLDVIIPPQEE